MSIIFRYAAGFAVVIACIGLFGLASFMAEKRIKEIGIRKTLGASVSGITVMLSKEFVKWVMIANVVAWPVAYYFMNKWLQNFAYRTTVGMWIFVVSTVVSLSVAILTVSYRAVRAAMANPVEALRYE
jgi:putative ABC transport system permease protein